MKVAGNSKRRTFVATLVIFLALLGMINLTYYTEHLLPILSPMTSSLQRGTTGSIEVEDEASKEEEAFSFNDETIPWPENWTSQHEHPAQILLTNYGWNHPNQTIGLTHARSIRSRKLLKGIIQHPWFRPISWDEVSSQPSNITTYVFLDVEMCFEVNWPHYYSNGSNEDTVNNRTTTYDRISACASPQTRALEQPIFSSPNTRLILFDCSGDGISYCGVRYRNVNKTTLVSVSASSSMHSNHDLGLPPPAGKAVHLTEQQVHEIQSCNESYRPLLYSFAGNFGRGQVRQHLKKFHNGKDVLVVSKARQVNMTFEDLLLKSKFAGAPRGDNLFSYRFTEAMSAGAIPVVHADDWVFPFSSHLIDWSKCAVIIPESRANDTISIISSLSAEERCEMRKCVLNVYQKYMSTHEAAIQGIIESLELMKKRPVETLASKLSKSFKELKKREQYERLVLKMNTTKTSTREINNLSPSNATAIGPSLLKMNTTKGSTREINDASPSNATAIGPSFLFNDKTIPWPENWPMSSTALNEPKRAQILLTNYGWNHANQTEGLSYARSIRQTQFLEAIIKHQWFRPVSWDEVSSQPTNIPTYVFMDVESCFEINWPHYGGVKGYGTDFEGGLNVDIVGNRTTEFQRDACCTVPNLALQRPIFSSPNVRLIHFDCSGNGMSYCCLSNRNVNKTTVVSVSASSAQHSDHDLGLPPPAGHPVNMTKNHIQDVLRCNETTRPLLFTFAGAWRGDARKALKTLHNGKDVLVVRNSRDVKMTYQDFLLQSKFVGTPRGDDLFSYRFTEAMSAGAIPVVHADNWVFPFSNDLIPWQKCAVIIPEAQANQTISILSNITPEQRCRMRKCVVQIYHQYMKTSERTIAGIIQSLELERTKKTQGRRMPRRRFRKR